MFFNSLQWIFHCSNYDSKIYHVVLLDGINNLKYYSMEPCTLYKSKDVYICRVMLIALKKSLCVNSE